MDEAVLFLAVGRFDSAMLLRIVIVLLTCRYRLVVDISVCAFVSLSGRHIIVNVAMDLVMWGWVDFTESNWMLIMVNDWMLIMVDYWMHIIVDWIEIFVMFTLKLMFLLFLGFAHFVLLFQMFVKFMLLNF